MAWIESHTVLIRHRKLRELARELRIRPSHALGHLHTLWHAALEQREDGDLSDWSDEFIAEMSDFPGSAPQYVRLLQQLHWLDGRIIHDWLDYAGLYLTRKYNTSNRPRLVEIWSKHGRMYGVNDKRTSREQELLPPTVPTVPTVPTNPPTDARARDVEELRAALCAMFKRDPAEPWGYIEEHALVEVVKRPKALDELDEIKAFRLKGEFFPQSIDSLLAGWSKTVDRSRNHERNSRKRNGRNEGTANEGRASEYANAAKKG